MFRAILPLTVDNILLKTDEYTIFKYYCKGFQDVGKMFSSPLREDPDPSAIVSPYHGNLIFRDFGLGKSFKPIEFVSYLFKLNFKDTLERINFDLGLGLHSDSNVIRVPQIQLKSDYIPLATDKTDTIFQIHSIPHTNETYKYWEEFSWTPSMLDLAKIRNIDAFWVEKNDKYYFNTSRQLSFSYDYYWINGVFKRKIYLPNNSNRFYTNADYTIIQGWDLLPKNGDDILFITSSLKDIGPLMRLGYSACAPNNEQMFLPEDKFWGKLKPRFKRIIVYLDNDSVGITNALKWAEKYQIEAIWNPLRCLHKDQSDYWKAEGGREFNYLLKSLI